MQAMSLLSYQVLTGGDSSAFNVISGPLPVPFGVSGIRVWPQSTIVSLQVLVCLSPFLSFQNNAQTHREVRAFEHHCHSLQPPPLPSSPFGNFSLSNELCHLLHQLELAAPKSVFCGTLPDWRGGRWPGKRLPLEWHAEEKAAVEEQGD